MNRNNYTHITDVVYRLGNSKLEELFEIEGFGNNNESCQAIYEEIRDNYGFNNSDDVSDLKTVFDIGIPSDEIFPIIRFKNDSDYQAVVGVIIPLAVRGKVFGATLVCDNDDLKEVNELCKRMYEDELSCPSKLDMLVSAIVEFNLFEDVCEFVASKILERG